MLKIVGKMNTLSRLDLVVSLSYTDEPYIRWVL